MQQLGRLYNSLQQGQVKFLPLQEESEVLMTYSLLISTQFRAWPFPGD